MTRSFALSLGLALLLATGCSSEEELEPLPAVEKQHVVAVVRSNNQFALELHRELAGAAPQENLFVSPFSITTAIGMIYAGAKGQTATEIAQVLHLPEQQLHTALAWLNIDLRNRGRGSYTLALANRLWQQQDFPLLASFIDLLEQSYGASPEKVDFAADPEGSRQTINKWVEEQTQGKIQDLLAEGDIDTLTRVVLANAIYLKADWLTQFRPDATHPGPFVVSPDNTVDVPMMHGKVKLKSHYDVDNELLVVELPYTGEDLAMDILVPADLAALEQTLDATRLGSWLGAMTGDSMEVSMPRFELRSGFDLIEPLARMGMPTLFDPELADLSGMTGTKELYISCARHQAYVKVDEAGTEAAAATGGAGSVLSAPGSITIDRPFLFLVRDTKNDTILFMGRVVDPSR